jgi:Tol biopolymer transport system component
LATDVRAPDCRRLAYIARGENEPASATPRLWVVRADGTGRRPISPAGVMPADPGWSPDGRSIVYVDPDGLSITDVRSGRSRRVSRVRGNQLWLPSFRPDGRRIMYTRTADHGRRLELWTVPVSGGGPHRLLRDAAFGTWSPDGSTIAFRRFGRAVRPGRIWPYRTGRLDLMEADGHRVRTVLRSRGSMMAPIDWSSVRPDWSPDGTRIALATLPAPHASLRVLDLASHHVTLVGCGSAPTWLDDRTLLLEQAEPCRTSSTKPIDLAELTARDR